MGRPPLRQETTKGIMINMIKATQDIIFSEGLDNVTIRKIAQKANQNSATLYKYFKDLDELMMFACVDVLKNYRADLNSVFSDNKKEDPKNIYYITWKLFCQYAFQYPDCINLLFFSKHSSQLEHIISSYYELFPEQLENIPVNLKTMIRSADIYRRNLEVLRPFLGECVSEEKLNMINDLTVSHFRMLLIEKIYNMDKIDNEEQTQKMLDACDFLLTCVA